MANVVSALRDFQGRHGTSWASIIGTSAFAAALALAHSERIQQVTTLSDEEIAQKGAILLADLRGHLQYEALLLGLHEKKEFVFQQLPPEEYPDPAEEAREESASSTSSENKETEQSMPGSAIFGPTPLRLKKKLPPKGKPRKVGRPRKKL